MTVRYIYSSLRCPLTNQHAAYYVELGDLPPVDNHLAARRRFKLLQQEEPKLWQLLTELPDMTIFLAVDTEIFLSDSRLLSFCQQQRYRRQLVLVLAEDTLFGQPQAEFQQRLTRLRSFEAELAISQFGSTGLWRYLADTYQPEYVILPYGRLAEHSLDSSLRLYLQTQPFLVQGVQTSEHAQLAQSCGAQFVSGSYYGKAEEFLVSASK